MMKTSIKGLVSRADDFSQWYQDVIQAADLAEHGDVKGTMIIKPTGYALWERMQTILDRAIKATGHKNAYFPLFIPKSYFAKEAEHIEGFAKEMAVVTHHRLKQNPARELIVDPEAKLAEELIVRPTSETIIHSAFARWIQSWRDLPLLINQWANIVRMELRPRLFLRTTEFLWQEGHTAHATEAEAEVEAKTMLEVYRQFAEETLALPVILGEKTATERFPGALRTYAIEAMMQDGKALQAGTSHNLGQNFAKAFDVGYLDQSGTRQHVWMTSWGVSTRLIGGLIMTHSDDKGLVLPPAIAPMQIVIIPIGKADEDRQRVIEAVKTLTTALEQLELRVTVDERDWLTLGEKLYEWEKKGIPVRIEIGPRDLADREVMVTRRDIDGKQTIKLTNAAKYVFNQLTSMQASLFKAAKQRLADRTFRPQDYAAFQKMIEAGGFFDVAWCGDASCEAAIKKETNATIRCISFDQSKLFGQCFRCGEIGKQQVIVARAY